MNSESDNTLRQRIREMDEDRCRAPYTGWSREHLAALADGLLLAVRPYATASGARIMVPATDGRQVRPIDGLEGFARTFMLAAFRLVGERGDDPHGFADWYARGLAAGVDPTHPDRWPRPDEHPQAKVEAAAIAVGLHLTRDWLWSRLSDAVQADVAAYLSRVIGTDGPRTNWVWFRLVVEQFLVTIGAADDPRDVQADLAAHESFVRDGGWYSDGDSRAYDYYNGWALHLYPFLWRDMGGGDGAAEVAYRERFDRFVRDAVHLVGADGAPLAQGRSLTYRFAAAAPFWTAALIGSEALSLGQARRAAVGIVKHFVDHGVPDDRGLLSLGWFHDWAPIAQDYSGTGSPYWAAKGLLGLVLPAEHPVWSATEEPLPAERQSFVRTIEAPGWLVSSTVGDGTVRMYNHGTDHSLPGAESSDVPEYARLSYSTATFPLLRPGAANLPDAAVVVVDPRGRASHRAGFERLALGEAAGAAFGFSRWRSRWMDIAPGQVDVGNGFTGRTHHGPVITVGSVVRDSWEVRLIMVSDPVDTAADTTVVLTGWPVSGAAVEASGSTATAHAGRWTSRVVPMSPSARRGVQVDDDATPLGPRTATPWVAVDRPPRGAWLAVAVELTGADAHPVPSVELDDERAAITWWDGTRSDVPLPCTPAST